MTSHFVSSIICNDWIISYASSNPSLVWEIAVTRSGIKSTSKMKSTFNHSNSTITIKNRSSYLSYKTENKCMNVFEEVKMEERKR